jgi:P27 family predicted phage terminase small subunit
VKPGPRSIPTAIKVLNGNPGKRPLNHNEPDPGLITADNPLVCPEYLSEEARKEWDLMVPVLMRMRVLTAADETMVMALCVHKAQLVSAIKQMAKMGTIVREGEKTKTLPDGSKVEYKGVIRQNPVLSIIQKETAAIQKICAEFGLTPSSRVRLQAPSDGGAGNPYAQLG